MTRRQAMVNFKRAHTVKWFECDSIWSGLDVLTRWDKSTLWAPADFSALFSYAHRCIRLNLLVLDFDLCKDFVVDGLSAKQ